MVTKSLFSCVKEDPCSEKLLRWSTVNLTILCYTQYATCLVISFVSIYCSVNKDQGIKTCPPSCSALWAPKHFCHLQDGDRITHHSHNQTHMAFICSVLLDSKISDYDLASGDGLTVKDTWVYNHCAWTMKAVAKCPGRWFHEEKENGRKWWWTCKRKCTTGDKLHQTHSQERRPCAMHLLPPRCYYYLGTQPGVMVCQLFPRCLYWHPPPPAPTLAPRRDSGGGRGSQQSACGYMCGQGEQESGENMSAHHQSGADIWWADTDQPLLSDTSSTSYLMADCAWR